MFQVFGSEVAGRLGDGVSKGLCSVGAFVIPPAGVVSRGSPLAFHDHGAGGVKGQVNSGEAGIHLGRGRQGLRGRGMLPEHIVPLFPLVRIKVRIEGVCAISLDGWDPARGDGSRADQGMIGVDGAGPVEISSLKGCQFRRQEVSPSEVDDTCPRSILAPVRGHSGCSEEF